LTKPRFGTIKGIPPEFMELLVRLNERSLDGVIFVDDEFRIQLVTDEIFNNIQRKGKGSLLGRDYFETIFSLRQSDIRRQILPMFKAITTGKIKNNPPPTIGMPNDIAYQVETTVARFEHAGETTTVAVESWRVMGDPRVFEEDNDFIDCRDFGGKS